MKKSILILLVLALCSHAFGANVIFKKQRQAVLLYRFIKVDNKNNYYLLYGSQLFLDGKYYPLGYKGCLANRNIAKYNVNNCRRIDDLYKKYHFPDATKTKYFGKGVINDSIAIVDHSSGELFNKVDDKEDSAFYIAYNVYGDFAIVEDSTGSCIYPQLCSEHGSYKNANITPVFPLIIKKFSPLNTKELEKFKLIKKSSFRFTYVVSD